MITESSEPSAGGVINARDSVVRVGGDIHLDGREKCGAVSGPSPDETTDGGIINAKDSVVRVGGDIRHEVHHHHGPQTNFCPCCHLQIYPNETSFRCPDCGAAPIHERCRDGGLLICAACAGRYRREERLREQAGRIRVCLDGPGGRRTFYLFAKRTLQWGRSREEQLPPMRPKSNLPYAAASNDMVFRIFSQIADERPLPDRERSMLVSRTHGALCVRRTCEYEEVHVIDWGRDGEGSTFGTWMGHKCLAPGMWHACPDTARLTIGRTPKSGLTGLGVMLRVARSPETPSLVDAVTISRDDTLGKKVQGYIMVARHADVGLGPKSPISFGNLTGMDSFTWGTLCVADGMFVYRPAGENNPLSAEKSLENGAVPLLPGTVLRGGEFKITVDPLEDMDFCEP